ncbi:MAG: Mrp/NBP35 family ATP-binding protein [Candidatus Binatia bacterium]
MAKRYKDIRADGGSDIVGQVTAQTDRVRSRMDPIRYKVAVMSGKGGVGKSTITVNLAAVLASQGYRVGVLDADINGPAIAKMLAVRGRSLPIGQSGVSPVLGLLNIKVMSMDLLLPEDKAPVVWDAPTQQGTFIWQGTMEASALREFIADTDWGELEFLLVDLPPGAHGFSTLVQLLPDLAGTIMVTIPSQVSHLVVKKSIALAQELRSPLVGLVENMAGYVCLHCGVLGDLFRGAGDGEKIATELGVPHLGRIPFDPRISVSTDWGVPFVVEHGDSPAGRALAYMAGKVKHFLGEGGR